VAFRSNPWCGGVLAALKMLLALSTRSCSTALHKAAKWISVDDDDEEEVDVVDVADEADLAVAVWVMASQQ